MSSPVIRVALDPKDVVSEKSIAIGIAQALLVWSNPKYSKYLCRTRCTTLDEDWFIWFVGEWGVARTIAKGRIGEALKVLNEDLPVQMKTSSDGRAVDDLARTLMSRKISSKHKAGRRLPLSLVSKVAFLFDPRIYCPMDTYGQRGIDRIRGPYKAGNLGKGDFSSYPKYLECFNDYCQEMDTTLRAEINKPWALGLAAGGVTSFL